MPSNTRPEKAAELRFDLRGSRRHVMGTFPDPDPDEISSFESSFPFRDEQNGDILENLGYGAFLHRPQTPFDA